MLRQLINSGVHEGLSFKEQSKLRIFNSSCLVVCVIMLLYTVLSYTQHRPSAAISTLGEFFFMVLIVFINKLRKYLLAFNLGLINAILFIFYFSIVYGKETHSHIFFLFIPVAALIVFDKPGTILAYFLGSVVMLLGTIILFNYIQPIFHDEQSDRIFCILNYLFTGVLIFLGVKLFKKENVDFNVLIDRQKKLLEEKNKDITDSITYAKRIQTALMASDTLLSKNLPEYFVLYKPKDIVSGDFYWANRAADKFLLGTCDCTGHGVPGAFMSLLGVSFLNEITKERHITQPHLVFEALRENIISALNPEGNKEEAKDGMDAVLCSFDFANNTLEFASANNPIWILRNGEWLDFPQDKFPIGVYGELKPFTLQKLQLQKGDLIYTFTDGYADQFGGPKGKKFKYKTFKNLLAEHSSRPMNDQKTVLAHAIETWKGNLEQVDDILVIGIRV